MSSVSAPSRKWDVVSWEFVHGGDVIADGLSFEQVEAISKAIAGQLEETPVAWFDFQFPVGDGLGTHRMWISPGVAMHFKQVAP